ncbi:ATP-dependent DNA ligase [Mesorhizobium sp. WSM4303]|uniref:ATP-dependent DNA ligase n=1 Tax=unclassified Mesorhizobium TaxID=325217 RepID=UPI00115CC7FC|nr:ATP-dependent DNA ligase [Mesorhizobium sp. WSM4306]TRD04325.1 ATP-dependent DNA ligase [Mesorhizobium sp. WSM4303]
MRLTFLPPMEPRLDDEPPKGDEWIHEIKFDGYRTQIIKDDDGIRLLTRRGHDWTGRYTELAEAAALIEADSFILEGETIKVNETGISDFHALQSAVSTGRPRDIYLVAFDLLHLNGHDLHNMPLEDRREILQAMVPTGSRIQFSEAMPGTGDAVFHLVDKANLEGMVSKRKLSRYVSGPTNDWRKIKCYEEKDLDIVGVQRETGKPAMVLMADKGRYVGGAFVTFRADKRQALWDRVQGKADGPVPKGLKKQKAEWLKPGLGGRVKTLKGEESLRHATLKDFWEVSAQRGSHPTCFPSCSEHGFTTIVTLRVHSHSWLQPMKLLRSLHEIAASRGEGLHPDLLRMIKRSETWAGIEAALQDGPEIDGLAQPANNVLPVVAARPRADRR